MKLLKPNFKALVIIAMLSMVGSVYANTSSFSVLAAPVDTATRLDISWNWDSSQATGLTDTSTPTLTNWTAKATGVLLDDYYLMKVFAGSGSSPFEYKSSTGTDANILSVHDTKTIGTHTYTLDISKAASSSIWNAHLTGVAPVPEPGEWALMMSGLGLIGFMVRRRTSSGS